MNNKELVILLKEWFKTIRLIKRKDRNPVWSLLKKEFTSMRHWKELPRNRHGKGGRRLVPPQIYDDSYNHHEEE